MLTFNVYDRVFFVRGLDYGTGFTVDVDSRQYLVSARHVVGDEVGRHGLSVFYARQWQSLPTEFVGAGVGEIDITVLAPKVRLSPALPLEPSVGGFALGQEVFFAGYPYKMWSDGGAVMRGRPLPFVKRGTLSAAMDQADEIKRLYVDATCNLGFSGGPLVFASPGTTELRVAGVVSKFKIEYESVVTVDGEDSGMRVAYNTGFLVAYSIKYALDLIRANPIGLPI